MIYVVTEAGFGADLGGEKFIDIKCRLSGLKPSATVVVATIRALKMHGGQSKSNLDVENIATLEAGLPNLLKHLENMKNVFGLPTVVALNKFPTDTEQEIQFVKEKCGELGVKVVLTDVWAKGGDGGEQLAEEVVKFTQQKSSFTFAYDLDNKITEKIERLVRYVYGGSGIELSTNASQKIKHMERLGYHELPICMAKTPYSFSDDPAKVGRAHDFIMTISDVKLSAGAGFIVVYTGKIMTMPGLPKKPAAENIDVNQSGQIIGLF